MAPPKGHQEAANHLAGVHDDIPSLITKTCPTCGGSGNA